ncbi:MAG: transporter substrate-binding domain-containing protein [Comamonadaceae bacterium]|nr:transporter substrate-binding domain-containing protein [Comamonadaceae bacterium]
MGVRESSGALSLHAGRRQVRRLPRRDLPARAGRHPEEARPAQARHQVPGRSPRRTASRWCRTARVDIECGSTTNNAARQKDVAFAVTTYVEEVRIAVKANSGITSIDAAQRQARWPPPPAPPRCSCCASTSAPPASNFEEVFGKDHADSFLLLETGRADAFVMDGQILAGNIAKAKNPADFKIVGEVLSVEPIAIMLRKDDPAFKKAVDDSIERDDEVAARSPSCTTSGSCSRSRRPTRASACRPATPPRPPGRTRTTSRSRST